MPSLPPTHQQPVLEVPKIPPGARPTFGLLPEREAQVIGIQKQTFAAGFILCHWALGHGSAQEE